MDLRQQLEDVLRPHPSPPAGVPHPSPSEEGATGEVRICVIGLGNTEYGDDGFGQHLAANLIAAGIPHVVTAGNTPERYLGRVADSKFDRVLFVDAVDAGAAPGSVVLLNSSEMSSKFPQISTHKISLGLLARWAEENGVGEVWLLGVQPESMRSGDQISPKLQETLEILTELLHDILTSLEVTEKSSAGVNS